MPPDRSPSVPLVNWHQISIVVPAYNEREAIGSTLESLLRHAPGAEILVVDDGSEDGTADAACRAGVTVVRHGHNRGQGAALKSGMRKATRPVIAWFDADNEHRIEDLVALLAAVDRGPCVAAVGQRRNVPAPVVRGLGKWLIRMLAWSLHLRAGPDLNCGLRAFRRDIILRYLPLLPDRFSASLTTSLILAAREYPVVYLPVALNPRIGTSKVRLRDGFDALTLVLRMVMLFAPLRIFFRLGLLLMAIGLAYGLTVAYVDRLGFPTAGLIAVLGGLFLCLQGLIADQISQIRLERLEAGAAPAQPGPGGDRAA